MTTKVSSDKVANDAKNIEKVWKTKPDMTLGKNDDDKVTLVDYQGSKKAVDDWEDKIEDARNVLTGLLDSRDDSALKLSGLNTRRSAPFAVSSAQTPPSTIKRAARAPANARSRYARTGVPRKTTDQNMLPSYDLAEATSLGLVVLSKFIRLVGRDRWARRVVLAEADSPAVCRNALCPAASHRIECPYQRRRTTNRRVRARDLQRRR